MARREGRRKSSRAPQNITRQGHAALPEEQLSWALWNHIVLMAGDGGLLIGAKKHQQVLRRAFRLHDKESRDRELQRLYEERTLASFSSTYQLSELGTCDDEWYALGREMEELVAAFVRQHPEMFLEP